VLTLSPDSHLLPGLNPIPKEDILILLTLRHPQGTHRTLHKDPDRRTWSDLEVVAIRTLLDLLLRVPTHPATLITDLPIPMTTTDPATLITDLLTSLTDPTTHTDRPTTLTDLATLTEDRDLQLLKVVEDRPNLNRNIYLFDHAHVHTSDRTKVRILE